MMMLAGRSFPTVHDKEAFVRDFLVPFQTHASWKINAFGDAEAQRYREAQESREKKRKEAGISTER